MSMFSDRREAGQRLGEALVAWRDEPHLVVLGLPRGGVPVAAEVARALGAPLDVFVVRKLGLPQYPEVAMGAVAVGARWLNTELIAQVGVTPDDLARVEAREQQELQRREQVYRAGKGPLDLRGKTVLLIDDGLATGATMHAAVQAVRALEAAKIGVAVPVAAPDTLLALGREANEAFSLLAPQGFRAVGQFYREFGQTSDAEVLALLEAGKPD
ncbi:phosphoribosyltransferase [Deinococcus cavernae]|uniref:Phosphoribosyltransferase n=1 Tax=Deinococcus cavernae TaxID=2320857 RepID=A0A418V8K6_9DEIO|nr:phosphoribosyltransferase [Deinococcus cavernae]RJF72412.1 phosphoribosyltransferase [Deinococcus cavernae]